MRRATWAWLSYRAFQFDISIHALHEESDLRKSKASPTNSTISIHALHEESDGGILQPAKVALFQSTLSMRRATATELDSMYKDAFQSTLSMRRATSAWY